MKLLHCKGLKLTEVIFLRKVLLWGFQAEMGQNHLSVYNTDFSLTLYQVGINLLKVNKRNTRTRCGICSKLTIKTPELLVSLLLILNVFNILF